MRASFGGRRADRATTPCLIQPAVAPVRIPARTPSPQPESEHQPESARAPYEAAAVRVRAPPSRAWVMRNAASYESCTERPPGAVIWVRLLFPSRVSVIAFPNRSRIAVMAARDGGSPGEGLGQCHGVDAAK